MRAALTITAKDLRLRLRDRSVFIFGLVAPLVLAVVLGTVFGAVDDGITLDLGVVRGADEQVAGPFVEQVLPALQENGLVTGITEFDDADRARAAVETGALTAAVVFGEPGPTGPGDVEVIGSVDSPTGVGITEAVVRDHLQQVRTITTTVSAGLQLGVGDVDELVDAAQEVAPVLRLEDAPVGRTEVSLVTYMSGAMAVFFLLFAAGIAVTGLLEEERDGTAARLHTAPIPAWAPLAAKAMASFVVGVVSMAALAVLTSLLIGAQWGDPFAVAVLVVAAVLAATSIAMLVAAVARTPEAAGSVLGVVGTVLGALGGAFFPLDQAGLLAVLSALTPHRWFLEGLGRTAGGGGLGDITGALAALVLIAVVTGGIAVLVRRRSPGVVA